MLTITFVLCAVQVLAFASPLHQEQGGTRIALNKRQVSPGDVVDFPTLEYLIKDAFK